MTVIARSRELRVGTRASRLARTQTAIVCSQLGRNAAERHVAERIVETAGDRDETTPLPELGDKGIFSAELEAGLRDGRIDCAVHSLKDLPVDETPGLTIAAVTLREDPRDALVSAAGWTLDRLPFGARLGTCSLRRSAQLLARRPDLAILPLRGNVDTRVERARRGEYDAIVIAAAGLRRLGLAATITEHLPLEELLPAPGQGALALQCRADDPTTLELLARLDDPDVRAATTAERAFLAGLGGGCAAPIAAHGVVEGERLSLVGRVVRVDGARAITVRGSAPRAAAEALGRSLAEDALRRGAEGLL